MIVVVDSNIIFSSLLKENHSFINHILNSPEVNFVTTGFLFVEIFKLKDRIVNYSNLPEENILRIMHNLFNCISLRSENLISMESKAKARGLCSDIDIKDLPFVALTIDLKGRLWTGDQVLRTRLIEKGFTDFYSFHSCQ